jgi:hypothetical protein
MEVLYAWENGTPVIIIDARKESKENNDGNAHIFPPLSPWILYHSVVITQSIDEALKYLYDFSMK